MNEVLSPFVRMERVVLFVPRLEPALAVYERLGLRLVWRERGVGEGRGYEVARLAFPGGGPELELHTRPERQFADAVVRVGDLPALYRALLPDPGYAWLEAPRPARCGLEAELRTPDRNVWVLVSEGSTR
ncbi:VOC family protein [Calidithermus chliarophilus]|uniref:VOC family protein n=1 Tax=Calidithermus chliarophilus TaxID=52023 RepID=UPI000417C551|nr:VOC family protein [Calidithermus chliarophilus]